MLLRLFAAAAGGILLTAAFEPVAWAWLLVPAVAIFAVVTSGLSVPRAGLVGLVYGVAFYYPHISWMRTSVGTDAWMALAGVEAAFYGALGLATPVIRRLPLWPLWLAAAWATMETGRCTWPFSGMPWGRLAFAAVDTPVAPALAWTGMTGLSFALALVAFLLARVVLDWRSLDVAALAGGRWRLVAPLVGVSAVLVVPVVAPYELDSVGEATVAAVQGDVPGPGNLVLYDHRQVTQNHVDLTVELARRVAAGEEPKPDFVLWPENSTAVDPFVDYRVNAGIREAVTAIDAPVVVGGMVDEGEDYVLNQGIVWDPLTGPGDRYTKHHPVPYGEYIPYRHIWNPEFGQLRLLSRDMKSGTRTDPLRVDGVRISDAICFDVAYDDVIGGQVRNGAQLLTVQTSNATFIFTHQLEQQFAMTRLRAIEAGRWLVVASTNGISGVIAPDGTVVATADRRTAAVLLEKVQLYDGLTPATRLAAWPSRVFAVTTLVSLLLGLLHYRRVRTSEAAAPQEHHDDLIEPAHQ